VTTTRRHRRPGFTLLEVLLASAIAVMLLGALYISFDMTLRQTDAGREAVAQGDLGRALVNRMSIDIAGCLGPMPPKSGGGTTGTAVTPTTPTTPSTPAPSTPAPSAPSGTDTESEPDSGDDTSTPETGTGTEAAADVPFQAGVFGGPQQLTLFGSRVPPGLTNRETVAAGTDQVPADLMRATYYLHSSGRGLCRQVRPWVTADGVRNSFDPDRSTEDADLIAEEVTDLYFEYFDGASWAGEWDGSQTQTDGKSVQGPPRAVRVTLTLQTPSGRVKQIQHTFPLRAAVGLYQPPVDPAATTSTEGM
jgi:prepilin-type N-terminal cleavage/methylation domain-containing protein